MKIKSKIKKKPSATKLGVRVARDFVADGCLK